MALTDRERLLVFEVFGIPSGADAFEVWGYLGDGGTPQTATLRVAVEAVDELISRLTVAQEEYLRELLTQWATVSLEITEIEEAEGVKGVVESSSTRRKLLRDRIQMLIPFYRDGEIARQDREFAGGGNLILRG